MAVDFSNQIKIVSSEVYPEKHLQAEQGVYIVNNTVDYDNKQHINNTVNILTASNSKPKAIPSDFHNWIHAQGGEKKFNAFVASNHRKRSVLSNTSYSSADESSDEESDQVNASPTCTNKEPTSPKPTRSISETIIYRLAIEKQKQMELKQKKPSWFTGLFQKQSSTIKPAIAASSPPKKTSTTISNLFTSKKQTSPPPTPLPRALKKIEPKKKYIPFIPKKLPSRYPPHIERILYQISFMKLSHLKRPLYHQVLVSNMLYRFSHATTVPRKYPTEL